MSKRRKPSYIAPSWFVREFILLPGRATDGAPTGGHEWRALRSGRPRSSPPHDLQSLWLARRAARERPEFRRVLQLFVERGGPVPIDEMSQTLVALDDEDLIRIRDGKIDVAYPFTASPTSFVVRLPDGQDRFACCAVDALGIAPMIGQPRPWGSSPRRTRTASSRLRWSSGSRPRRPSRTTCRSSSCLRPGGWRSRPSARPTWRRSMSPEADCGTARVPARGVVAAARAGEARRRGRCRGVVAERAARSRLDVAGCRSP